MGRSAPGPASLQSLARSLDGRRTLRCLLCRRRKRQANHWPGSANQAEAGHTTLRPGRPTARYQCRIVKLQVKICFPGDFYPGVVSFEGGIEWAQCCGLHRALYEPHGRWGSADLTPAHTNHQCHHFCANPTCWQIVKPNQATSRYKKLREAWQSQNR